MGTVKVNPGLMGVFEKLGATGIRKCYDCGSCTVSCPFSEEQGGEPFPRKIIKYAKLGLEDRLLASLEPWLCYYCGDCSDTCPKGADPAGIIMAARRYLTIRYDFTGRVSKLMYLSHYGWLIAILVVAGIALAISLIFKGPIVTERTMLETFAPLKVVETTGILVFILLASFLLINLYRMFRFTVGSLDGIPITRAFKELVVNLPKHFFTQARLSKCKSKDYWYIHLSLFYGYALSFLLFMVLLWMTLTDEPFLFKHPLSILGIISTVLLLVGAFLAIRGRILKTRTVWNFSHHTDWIYIVLLVIVVLSGILTGIFRTLDLPLITYAMFVFHLMVVTPFLVLEVPFAKWAHLAYRPFAVYFARLNLIKRGGAK